MERFRAERCTHVDTSRPVASRLIATCQAHKPVLVRDAKGHLNRFCPYRDLLVGAIMQDQERIGELVGRVRQGDEQAAAELVRLYEPLVRQRVRIGLRMEDSRLRRAFDSMDVCQSVLASFFLRVAAGQYDLKEPGQLVALLTRMARNKLLNHVARQQAQRRDFRRDGRADLDQLVAAGPGPDRQVVGRELLAMLRERLSDEERRIADARGEGRCWAEIAVELGGTEESRRKQLARALDRAVLELGLDADRAADFG